MLGDEAAWRARRPTTTAKGLGWRHQKRRRALLPFAIGSPCALCGEIMLAGQALDLDHSTPRAHDALSVGDRIVHASCNRAAGGSDAEASAVIVHGEDAMVSASIVDVAAPVKLIRYCTDPEDGWWVLAADDLPMPPVEDLRYVCLHSLLALLDPEVEEGIEAARQDAADHDSDVGLAVWHEGRWAVCNEALDILEGLAAAE